MERGRGWALSSGIWRGGTAGGFGVSLRWSAEFFLHGELGNSSADASPVPATSDFAADAEDFAAVFQALLQVPFLLGAFKFGRRIAGGTSVGDLERAASLG